MTFLDVCTPTMRLIPLSVLQGTVKGEVQGRPEAVEQMKVGAFNCTLPQICRAPLYDRHVWHGSGLCTTMHCRSARCWGEE